MPPIESAHRSCIIHVIIRVNKRILDRIKWVSEIVLHSRSTYRWILVIAIEVELNFSLTPPIPYLGPTFKELGYNLCDTLIHKWTKGYYPEPIQKKI